LILRICIEFNTDPVGIALEEADLLVQLDVVGPQLVHLVLEQRQLLLLAQGLLQRVIITMDYVTTIYKKQRFAAMRHHLGLRHHNHIQKSVLSPAVTTLGDSKY
jgi:hypothetical protein